MESTVYDNEILCNNSIVGKVVDKYPFLIETFVELGFTPMKNPIARKTVSYMITLEQAVSVPV
jgi:hypothetical protein